MTINDLIAYFNRPIIADANGCWLWQGSKDKYGYALIGHSLVHGVVLRMGGQKCLIGEEICHKCNIKHCVNPEHLYSGTHKQNMQDAALDDTMGHGPRKLSNRDYMEMIALLDYGFGKSEVARLYNVSPPLITKLTQGKLKYAELVRASI